MAGHEHIQRAARGQDVPERVLNAFTTWLLAGADLATICATEAPSGIASPVALGLKGFVMPTMILSCNAFSVLGDDRHGAVEQHGEDDDVTGRGGAPRSGRGAVAER